MKTKNLKFIVVNLCIVLGTNVQIVNAQSYSGGAGTTLDPYQIANKTDLKYLSENAGEWTKHFIQTNDIAFTAPDFQSGGAFFNGGTGFISIGDGSPFQGSYNGDGHSIDGLFINNSSSMNGLGMFGYCVGASISNLHLTNVNITNGSSMSQTGGLAGFINSASQITSCSVSGSVTGNSDTGGLVGYCFGSSIVSCNTNCTTTITVISMQGEAGGLVGFIAQGSSVSKSYSEGSVIGKDSGTGGLVGYSFGSTISECYSTCSISENGTMGNLGGLVGKLFSSSTLSNSYANGSVNGGDITGGLVGYVFSATINNSYVVSTISSSGSNVGGLVGLILSGGTAINTYWNTDVYAGSSPAGTGKTTAELQTLSTFTSTTWDFVGETTNGTSDIWDMGICSSGGYPVFNFQSVQATPVADAPSNVTACDSYDLPSLSVGNYYTGSGGTGTMLSVGTSIIGNLTLYVYAVNGTCTDENSFTVTINTTPTADAPSDVTACDSYDLPSLTVGNYYTGTGGTGSMLSVGASITANQTLYVYAENGTCTDENSFAVTINTTPTADAPSDVTECDSYVLPSLTVGNYYTGSGGTGSMISVGTSVTANQTLYVYAVNGTCTDENSFDVTINQLPDISTTLSGETISAVNTGATYQWLDCNNNNSVITGETSQTFTATMNGDYAVELTENGCTDTSICVAIATVGIEENSFGDEFVVYPNPTNGTFTIMLPNTTHSGEVKVLSLDGREISSKQFQSNSLIPMEINEANGTYIIQVILEDKIYKRLVVKH
ncbi:MAG: T9SS type A sorting domain-containing protein [Crocinitomicaceae bacterium]|nr:T9SS type A sorting domain-containing protein [Crocinitomicaceae bacterium]